VSGRKQLRILLAEDNPGDVFLVRRALTKQGIQCELVTVEDGEAAVRYVDNVDTSLDGSAKPDLILLDLNLPRCLGTQVLERLKNSPSCGFTPVIVLTSSDSPRDRADLLRLGAAYYFCKPTDLAGFMALGKVVEDVLSGQSLCELEKSPDC
jgi:DNA-binding response OmpR family regulator